MILHPRFINEVKNHPALNFEEASKKAFFGRKYSGFQILEATKIALSRPGMDSSYLRKGSPTHCRLGFVVVLLGEEVCRNKKWLNVSVNYAIDTFMAIRELRMWPSVLRPLATGLFPGHKVSESTL
ncbi:hypothetical protein ASPWEDRAFT_177067 [Aspergillus wentii DTO 134E9]|uniref:Uncharacterized protein n=1 Tax=Aspergillus wentii DTO 134E9 TaxID=1073089 RepID=A0A1L9R662_ASPWE|nr:uncharacterized protein ASPWEDRAFT_177067 [Aspergillus wentii DTO 134E9]OJJ30411.1 hypothetical protein ASPWEDRAFT_177067 [Aspergillus wentii DTO 134E9]